MEKIQIYIMTRNRPDTVVRSIESVLNQDCGDYELIVSDNSTNNETGVLLKNRFGIKVHYIKRAPSFESGIDHINAIHKEAKSPYYMIFHDDDEMLPNMVGTLLSKAKEYPEAVAIGSNAYRVKNGHVTKLFYCRREDITISTPSQLIKKYVNGKIAPFPSYLYKKAANVELDKKNGGKYADVACLATLCTKGHLVLCGEPLMNYNIHDGQDSHNNDFLQYMKLVNYLKRICDDRRIMAQMRVKYIYSNMRHQIERPFPRQAMMVLMKYSLFKYYIKYIINRCLYLIKK